MYKELLSKSTLILEVQTVAFWSHPYAGGAISCFLNQLPTLVVQTVAFYINSLRWRYKQLLSTSTPNAGGTNNWFVHQLPTLEVQTVAFCINPYTGGTSLCSRYNPTLVVQTVLLSKSTPYAGGTNSCILKPPLRCRYKQLPSMMWLYKHWWMISTSLNHCKEMGAEPGRRSLEMPAETLGPVIVAVHNIVPVYAKWLETAYTGIIITIQYILCQYMLDCIMPVYAVSNQ